MQRDEKIMESTSDEKPGKHNLLYQYLSNQFLAINPQKPENSASEVNAAEPIELLFPEAAVSNSYMHQGHLFYLLTFFGSWLHFSDSACIICQWTECHQ